jgi:hypothetical protein
VDDEELRRLNEQLVIRILERQDAGEDTRDLTAALADADRMIDEKIKSRLEHLTQTITQTVGDEQWLALEEKLAYDLMRLENFDASLPGAYAEVLYKTKIDPLRLRVLEPGTARLLHIAVGEVWARRRTGRPRKAARERAATIVADIRPVAELMRQGLTPEAAVLELVKTEKEHGARTKRYHRAMRVLARTVANQELIERLGETETFCRTTLTDKQEDAG